MQSVISRVLLRRVLLLTWDTVPSLEIFQPMMGANVMAKLLHLKMLLTSSLVLSAAQRLSNLIAASPDNGLSKPKLSRKVEASAKRE